LGVGFCVAWLPQRRAEDRIEGRKGERFVEKVSDDTAGALVVLPRRGRPGGGLGGLGGSIRAETAPARPRRSPQKRAEGPGVAEELAGILERQKGDQQV